MKKQFTGTCICGHSWDDHHHGIIMRTDLLKERNEEYRNVNGLLGEECEHDIFEGYLLSETPCTCYKYVDIGWVEDNEIWTSYFDEKGNKLEIPITRLIKDLDTEHIIKILKSKLVRPQENKRITLETELKHRNENMDN